MVTNGSPTVPQALGRLRVALDDSFDRVSRRFGLSAQQAELLCAAMCPSAVGDLARSLRCDRSNVTRLADRAAQRGLLTRRNHEADARVTLIELSPEGRDVAERFIAALEDELADLLVTWPARRQREVARVLGQLSEELEARAEDPPGGSSPKAA